MIRCTDDTLPGVFQRGGILVWICLLPEPELVFDITWVECLITIHRACVFTSDVSLAVSKCYA